MAAEIKSGATADLLTIDPTSKASRVTLYDSLGNKTYEDRPTGSYLANINFTTGAGTAGQAFWIFRNPAGSGRSLFIRNIRGRLTWAGTAVAAATYGIEIIRFTSAADIATTGTTIPISKKQTVFANSVVTAANIAQKDTVLTVTGATFETAGFNVIMVPASVTGTVSQFDLDFSQSGLEYETLDLSPTEGIMIRVVTGGTTHTAGFRVGGTIEWDER
jgi:hypothetical protein